jgi:hypothetical protein
MGLFGKAKTTLVVDVAAVLKAKGARGNIAPRQQLQILRSLSRFVQREKLKVTAVLVGQPLNKAPHNKIFDGVRVRYAKSDEALNSELLKALGQAGSGGVLVTEDVALEKRALQAGKETLRVSTVRKVLDDGNEPDLGGGNGGGSRRGDRKPRRDRGPRQNQKKKQKEEPSSEQKREDAISQMIDLVD